ncbi:MAG: hypothetical protein K0B02_02675 [DPANN group archaeon]|nr:hypothetical protein [DPANN group archaeon]
MNLSTPKNMRPQIRFAIAVACHLFIIDKAIKTIANIGVLNCHRTR